MASIDQETILQKLAFYYNKQGLQVPLDMAGMCNGLSALYSYKKAQGQAAWFFDLLRRIANAQPDDLEDFNSDLEKLVNHITWLHTPMKLVHGIRQYDFKETLGVNPEFKIAFTFNDAELEQLLDDCVKEGKMVHLGSVGHFMALHKQDGRFYFYDPNHEDGEQVFDTSAELAKAIRNGAFVQANPQEPFSLSLMSYGFNSEPDINYPDKIEYLKAMVAKRDKPGWADGFMLRNGNQVSTTPLMMAAMFADSEVVNWLLEDPNRKVGLDKELFSSTMFYAVRGGNADMVEKLLNSCDLEIPESAQAEMARLALMLRDEKVFSLLLHHQKFSITSETKFLVEVSDLGLSGEYDYGNEIEDFHILISKDGVEHHTIDDVSLFSMAAAMGSLSMMSALYHKGPQDAIDFEEALYYGVHNGHELVVSWLLDQINEIEAPSLLSRAAKQGNVAIFKMLWEAYQGDVELDEGGNTCLHKAVSAGQTELVNWMLINELVDVNEQNHSDFTPLAKAIIHQRHDIFDRLLNHPDIEFSIDYLALAIECKNLHAVQILLSALKDEPLFDLHGGDSLLHLAAVSGDPYILAVLIDAGFAGKLDLVDGEGYTPLIRAIMNAKPLCVQTLIEAGADVELAYEKDQDATPLLLAIREGDSKVFDAVLSAAQIDPNCDIQGYPLVALAAAKGVDMLEVAVGYGADIDTPIPENNNFSLLYSQLVGEFDETTQLPIIEKLLALGANPNQVSPDESKTPIMIQACVVGYLPLVKALLDQGADPTKPNAHGITALSYAKETENANLLELIESYQQALGTKQEVEQSADKENRKPYKAMVSQFHKDRTDGPRQNSNNINNEPTDKPRESPNKPIPK